VHRSFTGSCVEPI
jgi:hypothetical protein